MWKAPFFHYKELGGLHGFFTVHCIQILEVRGKLVTIKSAQHHNGSLETSRQTRLESALMFNEHLACAFPLKLS